MVLGVAVQLETERWQPVVRLDVADRKEGEQEVAQHTARLEAAVEQLAVLWSRWCTSIVGAVR